MSIASPENNPPLYPPNCSNLDAVKPVAKPIDALQQSQIGTLTKHSETVGKVLDAVARSNTIHHYQELATNGKTERIRERAMRNLAKWAMLGKPLQLINGETALKQAGNNIQININLIQPTSMQEVLDTIPEVK